MLRSFSDPAAGVPEPPGDFNSNYRYLKQLINKALKEGTPTRKSTRSCPRKVPPPAEPRKL